MKTKIVAALAAPLAFAGAAQAAPLLFDQNVTPDVIFGSGNANGGFTVDRSNGIEIGLRGKVRFNASNQPENTFNSNGAGTYSFDTGAPSPGFGFAPNNPQAAKWNFEWSINSDFDGSTGLSLDDLDYQFAIDGDPGAGTSIDVFFDPINSFTFADHAIGNNTTGNGGGSKATDEATYAALIGSNNVAQNSVNFLFLVGLLPQLSSFDPNERGLYTITLSAFAKGTSDLLASSTINVQVGAVPLPATLPLLLGALGAVAFIRRKRA